MLDLQSQFIAFHHHIKVEFWFGCDKWELGESKAEEDTWISLVTCKTQLLLSSLLFPWSNSTLTFFIAIVTGVMATSPMENSKIFHCLEHVYSFTLKCGFSFDLSRTTTWSKDSEQLPIQTRAALFILTMKTTAY